VQRTLKIFFHDNCFDGTASAAVFSDFYLKHIDERAVIRYQGVQHQDGDPFEGLALDTDDNACLDFRYDERMTWWFDHHVSAFQPPERRAHFENDASGKKFYDPTALSCTRYMAETLAREFGYQVPEHFQELIQWAHIIDSAQFDSPRIPVTLDRPATRLMTWVRYNRDPELMHRYIRALGHMSLDALVAENWIQSRLGDLLQQHERTMELVRKHALIDGGVVFVDLADENVPGYNSFISYYLFPESLYTVGLVCTDDHARISVGYNPWSRTPRTHNIAEICERFGGGGHATVGGVAVPASQLSRGRVIANAIRLELSTDQTG
jgi:hypothetical protein